jgi:hypothetical protein
MQLPTFKIAVVRQASRASAGAAAGPFPAGPLRTRRAPLSAAGAPRVFPAGQLLVAAAGPAVRSVVMLLPR